MDTGSQKECFQPAPEKRGHPTGTTPDGSSVCMAPSPATHNEVTPLAHSHGHVTSSSLVRNRHLQDPITRQKRQMSLLNRQHPCMDRWTLQELSQLYPKSRASIRGTNTFQTCRYIPGTVTADTLRSVTTQRPAFGVKSFRPCPAGHEGSLLNNGGCMVCAFSPVSPFPQRIPNPRRCQTTPSREAFDLNAIP